MLFVLSFLLLVTTISPDPIKLPVFVFASLDLAVLLLLPPPLLPPPPELPPSLEVPSEALLT